MIMKKKKNTARIVDNSSVNYTFTNNALIPNQTNEPVKERSSQKPNITKMTKKDLKNLNRYKANSKTAKSMQNHSPVYE
ncbi:hypothetical protein [Candidatus Nitrosotenuis aquarius]|uniref:hypothetical protein n=1 Tax=Candidatus Nitrosotenuis aquarius TaxID=1846278 RepID=UPI0013C2F828|nr:hypothetical protein [Candidatus Nitrosotenuis aquarius]